MKIAVVGAGAAGTAAAWKARRSGAEVTVFHERPGASALACGALDLSVWEASTADVPLDADLLAFATALGLWSLGARSCQVATEGGIVRPARGVDSALLDLSLLRGRTIAVPEVSRVDFDGAWLCRALSESPWAGATRTRFLSVSVPLLRSDGEARLAAYDFASLHDEPDRAQFLADRLRAAKVQCDGWLFGPWLGISPGSADVVRDRLGLPCGETTSGVGGPAGARFEAARDELLASTGAEVERVRVRGVKEQGGRVELSVGGTEGRERILVYDRVVLALGGVASGGVVLDEPVVVHASGSRFRLSLEAPLFLSVDGMNLDRASSLHGVDVHARGLGLLEKVGIATDGLRAIGSENVFAAGDVVADRPRTALEAARAGIAAARAAVNGSHR